MDIRARMNKSVRRLTRTKLLTAFLLPLFVVSCGGGDGISIGDGQDPDPVVLDFPLFYVKKPLPLEPHHQRIVRQG